MEPKVDGVQKKRRVPRVRQIHFSRVQTLGDWDFNFNSNSKNFHNP